MVDLSKQSSLPLGWDPVAKRLLFGEGMENVEREPEICSREVLEEVLYDDRDSNLQELYYIYRDVSLARDDSVIESRGLRYDVTVACPGTLGQEYVKTAGHYHPEKPGTGFSYPTVYEVLHGRAHYLLQRPLPEHPDRLDSVILFAAKPGDKVLIPPQYGHIIINPGDDYLVISNWVARGISYFFEPIRALGGGAFFELHTEEGPEFIANKRYTALPPLQRCPVTPVPALNLITGLPLYRVFQENNGAFDFLVNPQDYRKIFENYLKELAVGA